ncbi:MAG TPA: tRNA (adenosine(37)-N6)-threonylcarbamoyltransferase complex dimerization subunit type 1 TsaB [Acetobacteraceae bacterium]|nr:tRNA (adenosine(37)-N6)-threonylcarbamoyltransferase complex dimerization subunit type 1 TsaB [Acetobacteraceae bacterium]
MTAEERTRSLRRILALDSAQARCSAGIIQDGRILAEQQETLQRGQAARLPVMLQAVLHAAGLPAAAFDLIAVTIGPGSFTGIRAGLALAHGLALATARPLVAVSAGEALAEMLPPLDGRMLWSAIDSRRGRIFLERGPDIASFGLEALPDPSGPVAVTGDAAGAVAARLAARGHDVLLTDARLPTPLGIALAALRRADGTLPPRLAQPLYVDAPEVRLPAGGLRPPPAAA